MVGLIIAFPKLVSSNLGNDTKIDVDKAFQQMQMAPRDSSPATPPGIVSPPAAPSSDSPAALQPAPPADSGQASDDDAMKRLLESMPKDAPKKP